MLKNILGILILSTAFSSCSMINSLERNKRAIDLSTCSIIENRQAIEEANRKIQENAERLGKINEALEHAG